MILAFDLVLILCLIWLLQYFQRDPAFVIVYAWSPLILKEYINTLHFDGAAISLLFLAIVLSLRSRIVPSALVFAFSIQTKLIPAFPLFFWIKKLSWKGFVITFVTCVLLFFPFLFTSAPHGLSGMAVFSNMWESNSSLIAFSENIYESIGLPSWGEGPILFTLSGTDFSFDAFFAAKITGFLIFILVFIYLLITLSRTKEGVDEMRLRCTFVCIAVILLCSPVCNPWYIAWIIPFLCFFPRISWFYLSISCFIYYTFFIPNPKGYPPWSRALEYIPFYVLWCWELGWWKQKYSPKTMEDCNG